jgi:hypothetical protein
MKTLQDWVYNVEAGPIRVWLVRIALVLMVIGMSAYVGVREFNGLRTFEAMDLAQQARQLAEGKGFTTLLIRPLALWQVRANLESAAPPVTAFPETLTPPVYPVLLAACFKVGMVSKLISFELSSEALKGFRTFPPDIVVLVLQLLLLVSTSFLVYGWALKQFDIGTAVLAVVFFLGSSPVWTHAVAGGATLLVVFLYALAGWLFCQGTCRQEEERESGENRQTWLWLLGAGLVLGITASVQIIQVWAVLAALGLGWMILRGGKWLFGVGLIVALGLFVGWLLRLWLVSGNPIGLNWAFLLADSPRFPGDTIWRSYSFNIEQTDIWRRVGGSILRGFTDLVSQGPALVGNAVAGTLALVACLHAFRRSSAAAGRNFWGGVAAVLILATAFIQRDSKTDGHGILMALLPAACVYGSAYLWIIIERWKLHLELLGRLFAILVALVACWPTAARVLLPEPPPFAYPPTYPPIFLFMRSWFEPGELQASDLPAAEAWYAEQPTLWLPTTREDFLKIHDRVTPVFSILFTPASSDARMYSQMLAENSEWKEWADLIRRQKPPDLPQAFATSLPPNNDYLLLSIQKRWN